MRSQMNKFTFYGNYSKALALTCMLLANNGYSAEEKDSFSDDEGSSIRRYVTTSAQEQLLQEEAANAALIRQIGAEDREFQAYQEDVRRRTEEAHQLAIHRADVKRAAAEVPFAETEVQLGLLLEAKRINNFGEVSPTFSSLADFFEYVTTSAQEQLLQEEAANAALIRQIGAEDREFQAYQEDVRRRTEEAHQLAIHRADVKRAAAEVPFAETEVQLGLLLEAKRINNFGEVSPTFSSLADFFEGEAGTRARLFSIYQELYSQHGDSDSAIATMATDFRDGRLL